MSFSSRLFFYSLCSPVRRRLPPGAPHSLGPMAVMLISPPSSSPQVLRMALAQSVMATVPAVTMSAGGVTVDKVEVATSRRALEEDSEHAGKAVEYQRLFDLAVAEEMKMNNVADELSDYAEKEAEERRLQTTVEKKVNVGSGCGDARRARVLGRVIDYSCFVFRSSYRGLYRISVLAVLAQGCCWVLDSTSRTTSRTQSTLSQIENSTRGRSYAPQKGTAIT